MVDYVYAPQAAINIETGLLITQEGLSGSVYASEANAASQTSPLSIVVAGGVPTTTIAVSPIGQIPEFTVADRIEVWWSSGGGVVVHLVSFQGLRDLMASLESSAAASASAAAAAQAAAEAAAAGSSGTGSATWTGITGKPATFPPSSHSHTRSEISDSTTVGRAVLGAVDPQAARAAIGAGTGNGTSNLVLGSTGSTAMPGNRIFSDAEITANAKGALPASTVRAQIQALEARTGSVPTDTVNVLWSSGAYPAQAASPPAGVKVRHFYGPVAPSAPTWPGVLDTYDYAAL